MIPIRVRLGFDFAFHDIEVPVDGRKECLEYGTEAQRIKPDTLRVDQTTLSTQRFKGTS